MLESFVVAYFLYQVTLPSAVQRQPTSPVPSQAAALTVTARRPMGRTFPPGSQRVSMLELTLQASCDGDVSVASINVRRRGLGLSSDITGVYALQGIRRLTNAVQPSRDGLATLRFRGFVIPACGSETITLAADVSGDAAIAGEHWLAVERPSDIDANGAAVRVVRATTALEPLRTGGGEPTGTISVAYRNLTQPVRYGSRQVLARVLLTADSRNDHAIAAITFTNQGSARDTDLQHIFLETGRTRSRVTAKLDGDRVRVVFDPPLLLEQNQERLLNLRGDVRASRRRTLQFLIEESSDIEAVPTRGR